MSYKPIGGVRSVSLHTASVVGLNRNGIAVELVDDSSRYLQTLRSDRGVITVEHTLTLVAYQDKAAEWLESEFIDQMTLEGVVAKVVLNSGIEKVVGRSDTMAFDQPLRLKSLTIDSSLSAAQTPVVTLVLYSEDSTIK